MDIKEIDKNISRLIKWRAECHSDAETQKRINIQLSKLYDFKIELSRV